MESLPSAIVDFIHLLRPLFRVEVFTSFCYLMLGILIGEAKYGTARASVFAGADYWPQRLSDLFCRHKLSHQAFMAKLVEVALASLYPAGLPMRLFWIADSTYAEKPFTKRTASIGLFHRTKRVVGRAKHLKGHCYVFGAHLYTQAAATLPKWASVLVGALVYVQGRSIPTLVGALAQQLRLPRAVRHVWLVDRGILSAPCCGRWAIWTTLCLAASAVTRSCTLLPHWRRCKQHASDGPVSTDSNAGSISCKATVRTACGSRRWSYVSTGASASSKSGMSQRC
jgi:hypothetical protein